MSKNLAHPLHPVYDDSKGGGWKWWERYFVLLNSHISAYARYLAGKVCGPVRSTGGTSLGEDKLGARDRILNTKVARRACARQTFPCDLQRQRLASSMLRVCSVWAPLARGFLCPWYALRVHLSTTPYQFFVVWEPSIARGKRKEWVCVGVFGWTTLLRRSFLAGTRVAAHTHV